MSTPVINFDCPRCGQNLEADADTSGSLIDCPSCKQSILIPGRAAVRMSAPAARKVFIEKQSEPAGTGCLVQLLGVIILCVFWPFSWIAGLLIGFTLLALGARMAEFYRCGACKNKLVDTDVRLCPACHAELTPQPEGNAVLLLGIIIAVTFGIAIVCSLL